MNKEDNWISVKDRLPNHMNHVLVYMPLEFPSMATNRYYDNLKTWDMIDSKKRITHWQELPSTPK